MELTVALRSSCGSSISEGIQDPDLTDEEALNLALNLSLLDLNSEPQPEAKPDRKSDSRASSSKDFAGKSDSSSSTSKPKAKAKPWAKKYYVVWKAPGSTKCGCANCKGDGSIVGIHLRARSAWYGLVRHLAGGAYRTGRDRLRGFETQTEAVQAYNEERAKHGAPEEVTFHVWPEA